MMAGCYREGTMQILRHPPRLAFLSTTSRRRLLPSLLFTPRPSHTALLASSLTTTTTTAASNFPQGLLVSAGTVVVKVEKGRLSTDDSSLPSMSFLIIGVVAAANAAGKQYFTIAKGGR